MGPSATGATATVKGTLATTLPACTCSVSSPEARMAACPQGPVVTVPAIDVTLGGVGMAQPFRSKEAQFNGTAFPSARVRIGCPDASDAVTRVATWATTIVTVAGRPEIVNVPAAVPFARD